MRKLLALGLLALAGCAGPTVSTLRFKVAPPVTQVADRTPLPSQPAERDYNRALYHADGFFVRKATRAMDVPDPFRAPDTNSLDEVPDSTWFTNRIGVREISVDDIKRGANVDPSPLDNRPWTITGAKVGGTAIGYVFEDTKGDKYLLKFDMANVPEMETAAHAMGHRIVWAAGYNVPQDHIGYIKRSDLVISPKASKKDAFGKKSPLTAEELDLSLAKVFHAEDGTIRVLASRFLPGAPIGPYAREGRRADDPNDLVPHERRRTLRGQVPLFSWINHTDMQEDNTLDAFIKHPGPDGKPGKAGHIVHYLIDWGKAFGVMGYVTSWRTVGYTYRLDLAKMFTSLITLGLVEREWDGVEAPALRGLGLFESAHFDPATWRANSPYWPYLDADRTDGYWGAKIVMRFTRPQIEAVVGEAQFSDPATAKYMIDTLVARQAKVGRYWFRQVSPFDTFAVETTGTANQLCFEDLGLRYATEVARGSQILARVFDGDGKEIAATKRTPSTDVRACVEVPLGGGAERYTIVQLRAQRNGLVLPAVWVHVAADASGALSVVGVRRD